MRIYLDNNILVFIEKKEIDMNDLRNFFGNNTQFVYSHIHINELLEAKNDIEQLQKQRLKTITELTNNYCIKPIPDKASKFIIEIEDPKSILQLIQQFPNLNNLLRNSALNFNIDRDELIRALSIDRKRINNYSEEEVIIYIDMAINNNLGIGLRSIIDLMGFYMHAQICSIFNLLDFVGFWKDDKSDRTNLGRMYDASHAYFASGCDIYLTNDYRARKKSKVAYSIKGITTKVFEWNIKTRTPN